MLQWAIVFLISTIITAIFGFGGITNVPQVGIAQILFVLFLALFLVSLFIGLINTKR